MCIRGELKWKKGTPLGLQCYSVCQGLTVPDGRVTDTIWPLWLTKWQPKPSIFHKERLKRMQPCWCDSEESSERREYMQVPSPAPTLSHICCQRVLGHARYICNHATRKRSCLIFCVYHHRQCSERVRREVEYSCRLPSGHFWPSMQCVVEPVVEENCTLWGVGWSTLGVGLCHVAPSSPSLQLGRRGELYIHCSFLVGLHSSRKWATQDSVLSRDIFFCCALLVILWWCLASFFDFQLVYPWLLVKPTLTWQLPITVSLAFPSFGPGQDGIKANNSPGTFGQNRFNSA